MKEKEKLIGSICILIVAIIFTTGGYFLSKSSKEEVVADEIFLETKDNKNTKENKEEIFESQSLNSSNNQPKKSEYIVVDIKGAVKNPRDYKVKDGSRVREVIEKAGGLTKDANKELIHFSKKVIDEDCIIIPKVGEEIEENSSINMISKQDKCEKTKEKININKATIEEIKTLPSIGASKAQAIIDYRDENGEFKSIDELSNIDGIGSKTLDKLRDKVDIR